MFKLNHHYMCLQMSPLDCLQTIPLPVAELQALAPYTGKPTPPLSMLCSSSHYKRKVDWFLLA